ncbi:MAG: helix-turn-helix domain-containing protein [Bacteroidales bacterium]
MVLTNAQKHDYGKLLYMRENLTQSDIADKIGVTPKTLGKWIKNGRWKELKSSVITSKSEELSRIYMQIHELNDHIFSRPEGERFANSKEADSLNKLTSAARDLETKTSVASIVDVSIKLLDWLRPIDFEKAKELSNLFDMFIKTQLR